MCKRGYTVSTLHSCALGPTLSKIQMKSVHGTSITAQLSANHELLSLQCSPQSENASLVSNNYSTRRRERHPLSLTRARTNTHIKLVQVTMRNGALTLRLEVTPAMCFRDTVACAPLRCFIAHCCYSRNQGV